MYVASIFDPTAPAASNGDPTQPPSETLDSPRLFSRSAAGPDQVDNAPQHSSNLNSEPNETARLHPPDRPHSAASFPSSSQTLRPAGCWSKPQSSLPPAPPSPRPAHRLTDAARQQESYALPQNPAATGLLPAALPSPLAVFP